MNKRFLIYYAAGFAAISAVDMLTAALPIHLNGVFGNAFDVGLIYGIFPVLSVLIRLQISEFVFRINLKKALFAGLVIMAVSQGAYIFAGSSRALWLALRMIFGVGICAYFIVLLEAVNDEIASKSHSLYYGIFSTLFVGSMLFAPALGERVLSRFGFNALIFFTGFFFILAAAAVIFVEDKRTERPGFDKNNFYKIILQKHSHFGLLFMTIFTYSSVIVFLPLLGNAKGFDNFAFSFTFISLSTIAVRFCSGKLFAAYPTHKFIFAGTLIISAAIALFAFSLRTVVFFSAAALFGIGWAFFESNYIPSLLAGGGKKSELIAVYSLFFDMAWFVGPLASGAAAEKYGVIRLYQALPIVCLIGMIYFFRFKGEPEPAAKLKF
ncbi:MFS transporter [bacterium]|nr:MFS transporter [bacterium]